MKSKKRNSAEERNERTYKEAKVKNPGITKKATRFRARVAEEISDLWALARPDDWPRGKTPKQREILAAAKARLFTHGPQPPEPRHFLYHATGELFFRGFGFKRGSLIPIVDACQTHRARERSKPADG